MKKIYVLLMIAVIAATVFGVVNRSSYSDLCNDPEYHEKISVAQIPVEICVQTCERMKTSLMDVPTVVRITSIGEVEHHFHADVQRVKVEEVFKGTGITPGEEILLTSDRWMTSVLEEPYSMERGYVNILIPGKEYLVFLSDRIENLYSDLPVYKVFDNDQNMITINAVFCYDNIENVVSDNYQGRTTYVPYSDVKDNEFFSTSRDGLAAMENLKMTMLEHFPKH